MALHDFIILSFGDRIINYGTIDEDEALLACELYRLDSMIIQHVNNSGLSH